MRCKSNGFLVVGASKNINGISYCGVDTDVWPAAEWPCLESANQQYDDSLIDYKKVFLLDMESAVKYYEYCCSIGTLARLLYCESTTEGTFYETTPFFAGLEKICFLGYDYAFPNGDYYSAILNDIIFRNLDFSNKWKPLLNEHGLFSSLETICSFSKDRKEISSLENKRNPYPVYELGFFSIFRIFQIG